MTTSELDATVRQRDEVAVIDLTGEIELDGRARRSNEAYAQATGQRRRARSMLNFDRAEYINSTGIALIVGLLAQARAERRDGRRLRAVGSLPRDLRDHPPGRLHDDHRRPRTAP